MQETQVLEKGMATHSSIPAWRIPWTEEPGGLHPPGCKELDTAEQLSTHVTQQLNMRRSFLFTLTFKVAEEIPVILNFSLGLKEPFCSTVDIIQRE